MSALAIKTSLQPHGEAFGQGSSGSELNDAILFTMIVVRSRSKMTALTTELDRECAMTRRP